MSKNQFVLGKQPDLSIFLDTMVEMNWMEVKPQNCFDPLGYCGDPASFDLEKHVIEFF